MSTNTQVKAGKPQNYSKLTPGAREPKPVFAALATAMLRSPEKAGRLAMMEREHVHDVTGVWHRVEKVRAEMLTGARLDRP